MYCFATISSWCSITCNDSLRHLFRLDIHRFQKIVWLIFFLVCELASSTVKMGGGYVCEELISVFQKVYWKLYFYPRFSSQYLVNHQLLRFSLELCQGRIVTLAITGSWEVATFSYICLRYIFKKLFIWRFSKKRSRSGIRLEAQV